MLIQCTVSHVFPSEHIFIGDLSKPASRLSRKLQHAFQRQNDGCFSNVVLDRKGIDLGSAHEMEDLVVVQLETYFKHKRNHRLKDD